MRLKIFFIICLTAFLALTCLTVPAQTTEFTYQGNLQNSGTPANGNFDFEFALFDALAGGSQIGSTVALNSIAVANGLFSVKIDFGNQFPGAGRYLEIRVRQTGGGAFTTLSPRQAVSSSPYSVKSLSADTSTTAANSLQLGGVAAGSYVLTTDSRLTDARNPLPNNPNYIQNTTSLQSSSNFNVSGTGSANILNAAQFSIGGNRVLFTAGTANIFAGFGAGQANTTGSYNAFFGGAAGQANTTGGQNAFFGSGAGELNTSGGYNAFFGANAGRANLGYYNAFFGTSAGQANTTGNANTIIGNGANLGGGNLSNATALGAWSRVDQSNSLVLGSINGINGATADTNVGIGTTTPSQRLQVVGNGLINGNLTVTGTLTAFLPAGSTYYVQNQNVAPQTNSNFYISGTGAANILSAETQYDLGGGRFLSMQGGNLFVGPGAGVSNTTGINNAFVGRFAGSTNTTGRENSFFGNAAGQTNSTGYENSFFGSFAGNVNNGSFNVFFGSDAGRQNDLGNSNSFFGRRAGQQNTSGGFNTFLGFTAGLSNTTGSYNTLVGKEADLGGGDLTNATALGSHAMAGQSNSLVLGSINGVNGASADTSVGIGTIAPTNPFTVEGIGTMTGGVTGYGEVVARIRRRVAGHTAFSIDSVSGQDSILYLAENGAAKWDVRSDSDTGEFQIRYQSGGSNSTRFIIDSSGRIAVPVLGAAGATALCRNASNQIATCSSSIRYKSNIEPFNFGLELVKRLRPVTFNWTGGGMRDFGLVAEEVRMVDALLTTTNEKGEVEGVKYDRIGVVLVNAVNEQQAQIELLQKQVDEQKQSNESLRKQLELLLEIVAGQRAEIESLKKKINCPQNSAGAECNPANNGGEKK